MPFDAVSYAMGAKSAGGGGGGGGVLVVTDTDGMLNKTWQEIFDAMSTGVAFVSIIDETEVDCGIVEAAVNGGNTYTINAGAMGLYTTDSADGYPAVGG